MFGSWRTREPGLAGRRHGISGVAGFGPGDPRDGAGLPPADVAAHAARHPLAPGTHSLLDRAYLRCRTIPDAAAEAGARVLVATGDWGMARLLHSPRIAETVRRQRGDVPSIASLPLSVSRRLSLSLFRVGRSDRLSLSATSPACLRLAQGVVISPAPSCRPARDGLWALEAAVKRLTEGPPLDLALISVTPGALDAHEHDSDGERPLPPNREPRWSQPHTALTEESGLQEVCM